jgi:SNF2 family DNA or RNA helicase
MVEQFQAGDRRLLFAQVETGGIGINLTAARTAIFVTRSWSLEHWLQAQDRLHRIGQAGTVSIISLIAEGSIDEDISDALEKKQNIADHLTGDHDRRALVAKILGK